MPSATTHSVGIEFDDKKDAINTKRHRLPLLFAADVLADANLSEEIDTRRDYGEERIRAWGVVEGACMPWFTHGAARAVGSFQFEKPMTGKDSATTRIRRDPDGSYVEILADGSERPYAMPAIDWASIDALTDRDLTERARADPDNPPYEETDEDHFVRVPDVAAIRKRLGMSQAEFARAFRLPLRTLQQWEQRRRTPELAVIAYLEVIDRIPAAVRRALAA